MSNRWTAKRKAALLEEARHVTNRAEFAAANGVDIETLNEWLERFNAYGLAGLAALKVQKVTGRKRRKGNPIGPLSQEERDYRLNKAIACAQDRRRSR